MERRAASPLNSCSVRSGRHAWGGASERLAERLLCDGQQPTAAQRGGHRTGASW